MTDRSVQQKDVLEVVSQSIPLWETVLGNKKSARDDAKSIDRIKKSLDAFLTASPQGRKGLAVIRKLEAEILIHQDEHARFTLQAKDRASLFFRHNGSGKPEPITSFGIASAYFFSQKRARKEAGEHDLVLKITGEINRLITSEV